MMKRLFVLFICLLLFCIPAQAANIRVIQIWNDVDNLDSLRPASAPVTVSSSSSSLSVEDSDVHWIDGDTVSFLQSPLPSYYQTTSYTLTQEDLITCVFINTHMTTSSPVAVQNTLRINDPLASLSLTKQADVASASDIFYFNISLPSVYPFTTSSGATGDTSSPIPLHSNETATISSIPVGTAFSINEIPDPRYESSGAVTGEIEAEGSDITINNTLITTSFSVRKIWQGTDKGAIELQLYADNVPISAEFKRTGLDGTPVATGVVNAPTTYTVSDLPKYNRDGTEIIYSATETMFPGYLTMYLNVPPFSKHTKAIYNGGTIVNRETTEIRIKKEWIGLEATPSFRLYQDGIPIDWNDVTRDGDWYIWRNLPKVKDGRIAVYTVRENNMPGYHPIYEGDKGYAKNGETIVNYWYPPTGDVSLRLYLFILFICIAGFALLRRR